MKMVKEVVNGREFEYKIDERGIKYFENGFDLSDYQRATNYKDICGALSPTQDLLDKKHMEELAKEHDMLEKTEKVYIVVNGTRSSNSDGGNGGYWVEERTKEEFLECYNNKITFCQLIGIARIELDSFYDSEDEAYKRIEELV